ncbi:MAG: DUF4406 domain-containing protein [Sphaerochaeta sp.]|nr:DUF4406 domain-containing protein [Sphaerochaeta sp.]
MKVYISGPMSGLDDDNRDEFSRMASLLQAKGHEPVNPHNISKEAEARIKKPSYFDYLRADLAILMTCDAYVLLDGWGDSNGARIEKGLADDLGIPNMTGEVME